MSPICVEAPWLLMVSLPIRSLDLCLILTPHTSGDWSICAFSLVGALSAADGSQTFNWTPGADLLQNQQCFFSVQRRRSGHQPLRPEQRVILERGTCPLKHGHLHRSHDTGESQLCNLCSVLNAIEMWCFHISCALQHLLAQFSKGLEKTFGRWSNNTNANSGCKLLTQLPQLRENVLISCLGSMTQNALSLHDVLVSNKYKYLKYFH